MQKEHIIFPGYRENLFPCIPMIVPLWENGLQQRLTGKTGIRTHLWTMKNQEAGSYGAMNRELIAYRKQEPEMNCTICNRGPVCSQPR